MNQPATMPPVNVPHRLALNLHAWREFGPFTLDCALTLELGGSSACLAPPAAARAPCCASSLGSIAEAGIACGGAIESAQNCSPKRAGLGWCFRTRASFPI